MATIMNNIDYEKLTDAVMECIVTGSVSGLTSYVASSENEKVMTDRINLIRQTNENLDKAVEMGGFILNQEDERRLRRLRINLNLVQAMF